MDNEDKSVSEVIAHNVYANMGFIVIILLFAGGMMTAINLLDYLRQNCDADDLMIGSVWHWYAFNEEFDNPFEEVEPDFEAVILEVSEDKKYVKYTKAMHPQDHILHRGTVDSGTVERFCNLYETPKVDVRFHQSEY